MEGLESTWFVHPESISVNITVAGNALQVLRTEWTPQAGDPLLSCPLDPKQASKQNQNELHVQRLNVINILGRALVGAPGLALFLAYLEPEVPVIATSTLAILA